MSDTARVASLLDSYVHAPFQRLKETHFEQMLLMVFARNLDLAQVMLSDQLPKGQRTFQKMMCESFLSAFIAGNAYPLSRGEKCHPVP